MDSLTKRREIEIRIGNVDLATKLDAFGAALAAVREAHRGEMSVRAWAALNRAQESIAEAMMSNRRGPDVDATQGDRRMTEQLALTFDRRRRTRPGVAQLETFLIHVPRLTPSRVASRR